MSLSYHRLQYLTAQPSLPFPLDG
ncbi:hypothetical protein CBM2592_A190026 [Cupriavidus taiwanensis]|nr:hypothetical protein CBM2592_A190026 [Cupriavidus taiwanensis]SOY83051.1 hypothetical protein CBM2591_A230029 [Cupriavidus taiwanensis]SOZ78820.1 hypothetical protein CBM2618_A180035 [Cupriavidus taiwanensis]SOZ79097.1 hypothetical protein CBM2622_A170034 [Cupriavidus taiwanensis]SOZ86345.1 hypothetical protein CBM2621_A170035 [Cupriavidus taiwanensis]